MADFQLTRKKRVIEDFEESNFDGIDFRKADAELREAADNLEKAEAAYRKKLHAVLIQPLDIEAIRIVQNSELMQLKERNDNLLYRSPLVNEYSNELIEKLYELMTAIEYRDEDGEPKDYVEDQLNFKICEHFLGQHYLDFYQVIKLMHLSSKDFVKDYASNLGRLNAEKRLENDPKQKALDEIRDNYEASKHQFKRRGFSSEFIRDMHIKYPVITAIKTIENLVSALNKENDDIPR